MVSQTSLPLWSLSKIPKYPNTKSLYPTLLRGSGMAERDQGALRCHDYDQTRDCSLLLEGPMLLCFLGLPRSHGRLDGIHSCTLPNSGLTHQLASRGLASFLPWPSKPRDMSKQGGKDFFLSIWEFWDWIESELNSWRTVLYFIFWGGVNRKTQWSGADS